MFIPKGLIQRGLKTATGRWRRFWKGLSVARQIVKKQGGFLRVDSGLTKGPPVTVQLPITQP